MNPFRTPQDFLTTFFEHDAKAFNKVLPRVRIFDIEQFDPTSYL